LVSKQTNAPLPEFIIENNAIVGIFDQDTGPVDIDLETFFGGETVSRNHAEIYQESGMWKVKDLGSTNGVFIKSQGQTRFSSRITVPTLLKSDDEVAFGKVRFVFKNI
jgi:pSer/pThr/pTyr-binding forkhead associated (FHA) protein